MRIPKIYTARRRKRLEELGLGPLLEAHPCKVHKDHDGNLHASNQCEKVRYTYPDNVEVTETISWREMHCHCWSMRGNPVPLTRDLQKVADILEEEAALREAEQHQGHTSIEALRAQQAVLDLDRNLRLRAAEEEGASDHVLSTPGVQERYDRWLSELQVRRHRIVQAFQETGMRRYQEQAVSEVVLKDVKDRLIAVYARPLRGGERAAVRRLIEIWAEETAEGRRHATRWAQQLVGRVAQHYGVDPARLGRRSKMWLQDAQRLHREGVKQVWEGSWDLVVYGDTSSHYGRAHPMLTPFLLREEGRQSLAALPTRVRKELGAGGMRSIRCSPIGDAGAATDVHEIISALWEPGLLTQDEGIKRLAESAGALLA